MKTVAPDYYKDFHCKAGACKHTCCAGWEIDIDSETLKRYENIEGELGARLQQGISGGHFVLGAGERCPFLNETGLCDIITQLGETALCQVCSDHPRFRSFLSDRTEIGLGLTCEAACELILDRTEPLRLITLSDDGESEGLTQDEKDVLALRDEMLMIAQDRSKTIDARLREIAQAVGIAEVNVSQPELTQVYLTLERLDSAWTDRITYPQPITANEIAIEQLLSYLIYRHILPAAEDGDIEGRTAFVLSSLQFIRNLGGELKETARMWSSEIEYSDENIVALTDACFE